VQRIPAAASTSSTMSLLQEPETPGGRRLSRVRAARPIASSRGTMDAKPTLIPVYRARACSTARTSTSRSRGDARRESLVHWFEGRDYSHADSDRAPGNEPSVVGPARESGSTNRDAGGAARRPLGVSRRNYAAYGRRTPQACPIVPPGKYTVRVKAGASEKTVALMLLAGTPSPVTRQTYLGGR